MTTTNSEGASRRGLLRSAALAAAGALPLRGASAAAIVSRWRLARRFPLQVANAMPREQYGFRPMPEMRRSER